MKNQQGSIIKYIFFIFVAILILSYFSFDLREFMDSETVVKNLDYLKEIILNLWTSYLQPAYEWFLNLFGPRIFEAITAIQGDIDIPMSALGIPALPTN